MNEVFQFVETFKEFPPRSFPPSFNPANILGEMTDDMKMTRRLRGQFQQSIERIFRQHGIE
jgi:arylsulfatase